MFENNFGNNNAEENAFANDNANEKNSCFTLIDLINKYMVEIKYFLPIWNPKAKPNKKIKKKRNLAPSQPKSSTVVRQTRSKSTFTETQYAEDLLATINSTPSLETSKSAGEVLNQPKTANIEKEPESNKANNVEIVADDAEIVSLWLIKIDEVMDDTFSDLESMPNDEIMLVSGDADEDDFEKETSPDGEVVSDKLLDEILVESHTRVFSDLNSVAPLTNVTSVYDLEPIHVPRMIDLCNYIETILDSIIKIPTDYVPEIVTAKNLTTMVNQTSSDMIELVELISQLINNMDTSPPPLNVVAEGEKGAKAKESQEVKPKSPFERISNSHSYNRK
nr:hypothetical protein [Tanacetum cinerariifolium]